MTAKIELAWAAGFFDGEGNIRWNVQQKKIWRKPYGTLRLQLAQIHREVLDRFASAVGAGNVNGPYQKKNRKDKDYFVYACSGDRAKEVFHKLQPYLSPIKIAQGLLALQQQEEKDGC